MTKRLVFHRKEIMADVTAVKTDWNATEYYAAGKATADLLTVAIGPIVVPAPTETEQDEKMPPKKDDKKSGAKAAAKSGGGGKAKKKKWSKGKVKEKLQNQVLFDKITYERCLNDVPKQKLITPSIISEKLKVNGSLARKAVKELISKNLIRPVLTHSSQTIYTRATNT